MSDPIDLSKLSDEQIRELVQKNATVAPDAGSISVPESFARGAAEGATFGFDDKFGLDKDKREASRKANPWAHFMGELAGGIAPMGLAALLPTGATQVAAGARGAQLAAKGAGLVRSALVPGEIATLGQAGMQGAKVGAVYGGLSGAGHTDVDPNDSYTEAFGKRAMGAAKGAGAGAVVGAPLGVLGHGVYKGAQALGGMRAAAQAETDVGSGALTTAVKRLERDRITPDELIAQIKSEFPDATQVAAGQPGLPLARRFWGDMGNKQPITGDQVEETVRRAMAGESPSEISAALQAANGGVGPGEKAVKTLLDELAERHLGPLNLVDRTSMVRTGAGDNTQMTMRAAAATPGEHLGIAREGLLERQLGAQGRTSSLFDRMLGSSDFEAVKKNALDNLERAGGRAYGEAFAQERPFDLTPIFKKWEGQFDRMRGVIPDTMRQRLKAMMWEETNAAGQTVRTPPENLQSFMYAREGLRDLIKELPEGNHLKRHLTRFYNEMTDEVAKANPAWKAANDIWRDGMAGQEALEAGARVTTRLNNANRENLGIFIQAEKDAAKATEALQKAHRDILGPKTRRPPEPHELAAATPQQQFAVEQARARLDAANAQQELFKVGLVRSLNDILLNQGETHDATKKLLLPGAQKILRQVLGDADANQFFKVLRAEQAMARTYKSQFGSQTTPLREAVDELNWAPRFEASWHNLGLGKALQLAQEFAARNINTRRNVDLMKLYTETDPLKQLEALNAMKALHTARSTAGNRYGKPVVGIGSGALPEALVAGESEYKRVPPLKVNKP